MAKKSSIEKNNRRRKLAKQFAGQRARLKAIARDQHKPMEERFAATLKLAELPRNSVGHAHPQPLRDDRAGRAATTASSRCRRIALRELGSKGLIPGLVKSSW